MLLLSVSAEHDFYLCIFAFLGLVRFLYNAHFQLVVYSETVIQSQQHGYHVNCFLLYISNRQCLFTDCNTASTLIVVSEFSLPILHSNTCLA